MAHDALGGSAAMTSKTSDTRPDHVVFDELFWGARAELRRIADEAPGPAQVAFLEFAHDRSWNWAKDLVTASLNSDDKPDDALTLLTECESRVPSEYAGYVHAVRGAILVRKDAFDTAIESFRKVIAQPGYLNPGAVWNSLGLAHAKKGDFDGAIDAYHKS